MDYYFHKIEFKASRLTLILNCKPYATEKKIN